jgi:hypothetical protein
MRLAALWEWWKQVAHKIGNFQARFILALFYYLVLGPFAVVVRWLSDPLAIKPGTHRGWQPRSNAEGTRMEQALRQS